jgi:hypothetical protein
VTIFALRSRQEQVPTGIFPLQTLTMPPQIAPREILRPLRLPGYSFLGLTLLLQLADFFISTLPLRPSAVMWRFSMLGGASNAVGNILLLILLLFVFALLLGDRMALTVIAGITAVLAAILFLAGAAFALDALQLRSRVDATAVRRFDVASAEAIFKFFTQGVVAGLMSVSALRSMRLQQRLMLRDERSAEEMIVVRTATPTPKPIQD